jgi:tetratricopeptide (TPR) repeat protein
MGARDRYEEALKIYRVRGDQGNIAWTLSNLADVATAADDYSSARELYSSSLRLFRELDDKAGVASVSVDLGNVHRESGSQRQAARSYREALAVYSETSDGRGCARVLESCSELAAGQRQERIALRLAAAAASIRVASGTPLPQRQQDRLRRRNAASQQSLGIEAETIWREGQRMALAQALESALAVLDMIESDNQLSAV